MKRSSRLKKLLAVSVLAVVCIGTAELAVCRVADPALYERIMAPVRRTAASAWVLASDGARTVYDAASDGASRAWDKASSTVTGVLRKDGEELESQAVLEPDEELAPLADPAVTTLEQRETGEVLTGGNREVFYYNQADGAWRDQPYGRDTLGRYGCGPTCLSMAVSSLTDRAVDPGEMARWAAENGHWAQRVLSLHCQRRGCGLRAGGGVPAGLRRGAIAAGTGRGEDGRGPDDEGPFHQRGAFHPPAGGHAGRRHSGGGPQQPGAESCRVGPAGDFGRAVQKPEQRRAAVAFIPGGFVSKRQQSRAEGTVQSRTGGWTKREPLAGKRKTGGGPAPVRGAPSAASLFRDASHRLR